MTPEKLKSILVEKEGTRIEFKKSQTELARTLYESVCAFLNRRGGEIILGVDDNGLIVGIQPDCVQKQLDILSKDMNNPQLFNPLCYLHFEPLVIEGKNIIYIYVPESSQAHSFKGVYYDRNQDGDFALRSTEQIANLFIRKSKSRTENRVYTEFNIEDLDEEAFELMRSSIKIDNANHPWLSMSNKEILHSGEMILRDKETGKEGLTLAAILLFGKQHPISVALPDYRIDLLCRVNDTELYDDRELLRCNLMKAYPIIMDFIRKHLPEQPYIDGNTRFSLRFTESTAVLILRHLRYIEIVLLRKTGIFHMYMVILILKQ